MGLRIFLNILLVINFALFCQGQSIISNLRVTSLNTQGNIDLNFNLRPENYSLYYKITCSTFGNEKLLFLNGKDAFLNLNKEQNINWRFKTQLPEGHNSILLIVKAYPYSLSDFSPYPYYLKSLALPGWGSNGLKPSKINKILSIGSYAILAAGAGFYLKSKLDYNSYKGSYNYTESEKLYSNALNELRISNIFFVGAGILWITELVRVGIGLQKFKVKNHMERNGSNYYILNQNYKIATAANKIWIK